MADTPGTSPRLPVKAGTVARYWGDDIADLAHRQKPKLPEQAMTKKDADPDRPSGRRYTRSLAGFLPVARVFLRTYSHLRPRLDKSRRSTGLVDRLQPAHAMLVLHVLDGLFDEVARVKYGLVATRMGKPLKTVQDLVAQMSAMRNDRDEPYVRVQHDRVEGDSIFDFTGLFHAVADFVGSKEQKPVPELPGIPEATVPSPPRYGRRRRDKEGGAGSLQEALLALDPS